MRQTTGSRKSPGEKIVKDIKRATRKHYSSEEKIRIVLDGLRGDGSVAELYHREGIYVSDREANPALTKALQKGGVHIHPHRSTSLLSF